jgi:hypothetical protein
MVFVTLSDQCTRVSILANLPKESKSDRAVPTISLPRDDGVRAQAMYKLLYHLVSSVQRLELVVHFLELFFPER